MIDSNLFSDNEIKCEVASIVEMLLLNVVEKIETEDKVIREKTGEKQDYSFDYNNFNAENRNGTLFICIENQLGNCLRVITSCILIAEYYNMNVCIDIDRHSLHHNEKIVIEKLFPLLCKRNIDCKYISLKYDHYVKYEKMHGTNYNLICEGRFFKPPNIHNFGITYNIYSILPGNMNIISYVKRKLKLYQSISYPEFLLKDVSNFLSNHKLSEFIGFHIRYTDNLKDKLKKKWNTPIHVFFQKLESYTNKNILICSDNTKVLQVINNKKQKKNNIIFANACSMPEYQGLYEMLLLSKTCLIIGSTSSSFSYESAFFQGTDIELFDNKKWILYNISKLKP